MLLSNAFVPDESLKFQRSLKCVLFSWPIGIIQTALTAADDYFHSYQSCMK